MNTRIPHPLESRHPRSQYQSVHFPPASASEDSSDTPPEEHSPPDAQAEPITDSTANYADSTANYDHPPSAAADETEPAPAATEQVAAPMSLMDNPYGSPYTQPIAEPSPSAMPSVRPVEMAAVMAAMPMPAASDPFSFHTPPPLEQKQPKLVPHNCYTHTLVSG